MFLFYRIKEVFWPPKWKAAFWAIFCLVLGVLLLKVPGLAMLSAVAWTYCLLYAAVAWIKFSRDHRLATEAKAERVAQLQQARQAAPSRSTAESGQLYVPPEYPGAH